MGSGAQLLFCVGSAHGHPHPFRHEEVHRLSDLLIGVGVVGIPGLFALLAPDAFASSLGSVLLVPPLTASV